MVDRDREREESRDLTRRPKVESYGEIEPAELNCLDDGHSSRPDRGGLQADGAGAWYGRAGHGGSSGYARHGLPVTSDPAKMTWSPSSSSSSGWLC